MPIYGNFNFIAFPDLIGDIYLHAVHILRHPSFGQNATHHVVCSVVQQISNAPAAHAKHHIGQSHILCDMMPFFTES